MPIAGNSPDSTTNDVNEEEEEENEGDQRREWQRRSYSKRTIIEVYWCLVPC